MRYFIATVKAHGTKYPFELVVAAATKKRAETIFDELIAHGHTISGMVGGVCSDNCSDIEGNDGRSDRSTIWQVVRSEDAPTLDEGDDELTLAGVSECAPEDYFRARRDHAHNEERFVFEA